MKVAAVKAQGAPDKLVIETRAEPKPSSGQILVRVRASSLNFHDLAVVYGMIPVADGRIPMSDGAGEVMTALQMSKSVTVRGITVGSREDQVDMIRAIEINGIKPVIDSRFPLDEIAGAFAHQRSQKHFGKICLEF